jgi:hypothetical protein
MLKTPPLANDAKMWGKAVCKDIKAMRNLPALTILMN